MIKPRTIRVFAAQKTFQDKLTDETISRSNKITRIQHVDSSLVKRKPTMPSQDSPPTAYKLKLASKQLVKEKTKEKNVVESPLEDDQSVANSANQSTLFRSIGQKSHQGTLHPALPSDTTYSLPKIPRVMSDLENLDLKEKIKLTQKAVLAKSTTATFTAGYYNRASNNAQAALLENVTTITGDYHVHSNDSVQVRAELQAISNQATNFLNEHFSADLKEQLIRGHGRITDSSGLVMNVLYEKQFNTDKPKINIVFSGTFTGENSSNQLVANANLIVRGKVSGPLKKADELVAIIKSQIGDNADLCLSGFSLGGAIASYAGLANDIEITTLSTIPLSDRVLVKLNERTKGKLEQRLERLTNLYVSKDEVTSKLSKNVGKSYKIIREQFDLVSYRGNLNIAGVHTNSDIIWIRNTYINNNLNIYTSLKFDQKIDEEVYEKYFSEESKKLTPLSIKQFRYELDSSIDDYLLNNNEESKLSHDLKKLRFGFPDNIKSKSLIDKVNAIENELKFILGKKSLIGLLSNKFYIENLYHCLLEYKGNLIKDRKEFSYPIANISSEISDSLFINIEKKAINENSPSNIHEKKVVTAKINSHILMGGDEIWPAIYEIMSKAEKSIDLQTYIYHEDSEPAKWVHKAIDEIQQRQINKMKDNKLIEPISINFYIDQHKFESVIDMKGNTSKNSISNYGIGYTRFIDPRLVKVNTYVHNPVARGSLHSKTVIVDGQKAVITSANLKDTHSQITSDGEARQDVGFIMTGDVVSQLQQDMNAIAKLTKNNLIGTNENNKVLIDDENEVFFKLREKYYPSALKNQSSPDIWHRYDPTLDKIRIEKMFDGIKNSSVIESDVLILSKPPKDVLYSRIPKSQQRNGILSALNNAEVSIKILGANLNGKEVTDSLINAIKRGVKVEILLPSSMLDELSSLDEKSNHQTYYYLNKTAKELNVQNNLDLRWQGTSDGHLARDGTGGKTHVKYMNIDGISIIGSMNLDIQSWKYSGELSMVIKDRQLNEHIDKSIFQDEFIQGLSYDS